MKKFIKVRTVAVGSATGAEIQNAYSFNRFSEYIINTEQISLVYPLENSLTNKVNYYFKIELVSGKLIYCHYDDYSKFDGILDVDDNPCIVVNLTNPETVKDVPNVDNVQTITDAEPVAESKPKKVKTVKETKTTKKTKKS